MLDTDVPAKLTRQIEFQRGKCRRNGGHGEGAVSEGIVRELDNQRTIDAAREGDEGRAQPGDHFSQPLDRGGMLTEVVHWTISGLIFASASLATTTKA